MIVTCEAKKHQAKQVSYCSTTVKLVNTLNKPPLFSLLSRTQHVLISNPIMEENGASNPKYQPLIMIFMALFMRSKTIPLAPVYLYTKLSWHQQSLT